MTNEELRIKQMHEYTDKIINESNDIDIIINKIDEFARKVWADYPKDVNFMAYSYVERAKKYFSSKTARRVSQGE